MPSFYITLEIPADSLADAEDAAAGIADYGEAIIVDVGPAEDIAEPEGGWCCQCGEAGHTDDDSHPQNKAAVTTYPPFVGTQAWFEATVACKRYGHHINPSTGRCNRCLTEG